MSSTFQYPTICLAGVSTGGAVALYDLDRRFQQVITSRKVSGDMAVDWSSGQVYLPCGTDLVRTNGESKGSAIIAKGVAFGRVQYGAGFISAVDYRGVRSYSFGGSIATDASLLVLNGEAIDTLRAGADYFACATPLNGDRLAVVSKYKGEYSPGLLEVLVRRDGKWETEVERHKPTKDTYRAFQGPGETLWLLQLDGVYVLAQYSLERGRLTKTSKEVEVGYADAYSVDVSGSRFVIGVCEDSGDRVRVYDLTADSIIDEAVLPSVQSS